MGLDAMIFVFWMLSFKKNLSKKKKNAHDQAPPVTN